MVAFSATDGSTFAKFSALEREGNIPNKRDVTTSGTESPGVGMRNPRSQRYTSLADQENAEGDVPSSPSARPTPTVICQNNLTTNLALALVAVKLFLLFALPSLRKKICQL